MVIQSIYGQEPRREGEYASCYMVGSNFRKRKVTRIEQRFDFGIHWFDVYCGDTVYASMNAAHVSEIIYMEEPSPQSTSPETGE